MSDTSTNDLVGNYNIDPRDRTNWYALSGEILRLYGRVDYSSHAILEIAADERGDSY